MKRTPATSRPLTPAERHVFPPMKPETIARRARERVQERAARLASVRASMAALVAEYTASGDAERASFWRDMLADHDARNAGKPMA